MDVSVIVPLGGETTDAGEITRLIELACAGLTAEVVFVDASRDHGATAIVEALRASESRFCIVLDADPRESAGMIPAIVDQWSHGAVDVVVASRDTVYAGIACRAGTLLSRALFPMRLRSYTDPLSRIFGVDRCAVHPDALNSAGIGILLEILARQRLRVAEIPGPEGVRSTAAPHTSGLCLDGRLVRQLIRLRFGRLAGFGAVGGVGAIANLLIMGGLVLLGMHYVLAAIIAAETTIITNFLLLERLVFRGHRRDAMRRRDRFLHSLGFNNIEAALRLPVLWGLVSMVGMTSVTAQATTLAAAFLGRYLYHSRVVYGAARPVPVSLVPSMSVEVDVVRPTQVT